MGREEYERGRGAAEDDLSRSPSDVSDGDGEPEDEAVTGPSSYPGESEDTITVEEELARERDELRDTVQRLQADFENFRKRVMRDQAAQLDRATAALVEELLPVLDSFELAVLNVPEGELDDAAGKLKKGVELVYAELLGVLEKQGLERIDSLGRPFDPEEHEAVMREGDGQGEPVVTEVLRTGYRLRGRVLRPAMVKVTTKSGG